MTETGPVTRLSPATIRPVQLLVALLLAGICTPGGLLASQTAGDPAPVTTNHQPALKLGIYPYSITARIAPTWRPLADYLQEQLQQPVVVVSAVDNITFARRAANGDYFLYIAAPHTAAWLETEAVALRVRKLSVPVFGRLLAPEGAGYTGLPDLAGKTIATAQSGVFVAELLDYQLTQLQHQQPLEITVVHTPTHLSALRAVLNGSANAAYITSLRHNHMRGIELNPVVEVERSKLVSYGMIMTPAALGEQHAQKMTRLLEQFTATDPRAATLLTNIVEGFTAEFLPIKDVDMEQLRPLVKHWRSKLD